MYADAIRVGPDYLIQIVLVFLLLEVLQWKKFSAITLPAEIFTFHAVDCVGVTNF